MTVVLVVFMNLNALTVENHKEPARCGWIMKERKQKLPNLMSRELVKVIKYDRVSNFSKKKKKILYIYTNKHSKYA